MTYKYITFLREGELYKVYNKTYDEVVGEIRKERMGQWMHWQLFQYPGRGFTNGCLKEISKFITSLYGRDREKKGDDGEDE